MRERGVWDSCDAEVRDLSACSRKDDVLGFDIAVQDAFVVSERESAAEFAAEPSGFAWGQRAFFEAFFEGFSFDVFEHEVEPEGRVFAHVVQRDEVWMGDFCCRSRFVSHACKQAFAYVAWDEQIASEQFDRHVASEDGIMCAEDAAHRAFADEA